MENNSENLNLIESKLNSIIKNEIDKSESVIYFF
jgi:hypothetical protein